MHKAINMSLAMRSLANIKAVIPFSAISEATILATLIVEAAIPSTINKTAS